MRERRRIAWILLLLAVLFALCWLPYNVLRLLIDLGAVGEYDLAKLFADNADLYAPLCAEMSICQDNNISRLVYIHVNRVVYLEIYIAPTMCVCAMNFIAKSLMYFV